MEFDFGIWKLVMIEKLYKLNKSQVDLKILEKVTCVNEISEIDEKIEGIWQEVNRATVDRHGAISDFAILQMHKDNLKKIIKDFSLKKTKLENRLKRIDNQIVDLQRESEKYKYLLDLEKKEKFKKMLKNDEESANEYIQSRY